MKTIRGCGDLQQFGIEPLTGEACGLMYRVLFDLTARGQKIIEKCLGLRLVPSEAWNRGTPDDPHIGSILLSPEMFVPIGIFALLESGCSQVLRHGDCLYGIEPGDSERQVEFLQSLGELRRYAYRGTAGDRNVHMMSGRVSKRSKLDRNAGGCD